MSTIYRNIHSCDKRSFFRAQECNQVSHVFCCAPPTSTRTVNTKLCDHIFSQHNFWPFPSFSFNKSWTLTHAQIFFGNLEKLSHVMKKICLVDIRKKVTFGWLLALNNPTNHLKWRESPQKSAKKTPRGQVFAWKCARCAIFRHFQSDKL